MACAGSVKSYVADPLPLQSSSSFHLRCFFRCTARCAACGRALCVPTQREIDRLGISGYSDVYPAEIEKVGQTVLRFLPGMAHKTEHIVSEELQQLQQDPQAFREELGSLSVKREVNSVTGVCSRVAKQGIVDDGLDGAFRKHWASLTHTSSLSA